MNVKQIIVMRKDLNMRKGKMTAQGSHASLANILALLEHMPAKHIGMDAKGDVAVLPLFAHPELEYWINNKFTKICVSVDSEMELMQIYTQAKQAKLLCTLITDAGLTEFNGVPTKTCLAIGPNLSENIDKITGHLKLL